MTPKQKFIDEVNASRARLGAAPCTPSEANKIWDAHARAMDTDGGIVGTVDADRLRRLEKWASEIAKLTKDGEILENGEELDLSNDDALADLHTIIDEAREIAGGKNPPQSPAVLELMDAARRLARETERRAGCPKEFIERVRKAANTVEKE